MITATRKEPAAISVYQPGADTLVHRLYRRFARWRAQQITIHKLQGLDDHTLKDIGLNRSEIAATGYGLAAAATRDPDCAAVANTRLPETARRSGHQDQEYES